jgi:hypothetical protein
MAQGAMGVIGAHSQPPPLGGSERLEVRGEVVGQHESAAANCDGGHLSGTGELAKLGGADAEHMGGVA